jgi:death on curing protein
MIVYLDLDDLVEVAQLVLGSPPRVRDYGLLSSSAARPATVAFGS